MLNDERIVFLTATFCPARNAVTDAHSLFVGRTKEGNELYAPLNKSAEHLVTFLQSPKTLVHTLDWMYANNHNLAKLDAQVKSHRVRILKPGGRFSAVYDAFSDLYIESEDEGIPGVRKPASPGKLDFPSALMLDAANLNQDLDTVTRESLAAIGDLLASNDARIGWVEYGKAPISV